MQENDADCMYGLVLCFLDSLHCAVEGHAKETGEWIWLVSFFLYLCNMPKFGIDLISLSLSFTHTPTMTSLSDHLPCDQFETGYY